MERNRFKEEQTWYAIMDTFSPKDIANLLRTAAQNVDDGHFDHAARHVANSGLLIRMAIEARGWDNIHGFDLPTCELDAVLPKKSSPSKPAPPSKPALRRMDAFLIDAAARAYRAEDAASASLAAETLRTRGLRYDDILRLVAERLGMTQAEILPVWDSLMDEDLS